MAGRTIGGKNPPPPNSSNGGGNSGANQSNVVSTPSAPVNRTPVAGPPAAVPPPPAAPASAAGNNGVAKGAYCVFYGKSGYMSHHASADFNARGYGKNYELIADGFADKRAAHAHVLKITQPVLNASGQDAAPAGASTIYRMFRGSKIEVPRFP